MGSDVQIRPDPRFRLLELGLRWPAETFLMDKFRSLAERGVEVRIACFPGALDGAADTEPCSIRAEQVPAFASGWRAIAGLLGETIRDPRSITDMFRSWLTGLPLRFWRLQLLLTRLRPDVLHVEWLTVASRCLPLLERWDGPVVISCRGSELMRFTSQPDGGRGSVLPALFARADATHVVSLAKQEEALAFGLDVSKTRIIRGAVDTELFRPPDRPRGQRSTFSIVSVGWLRWLKGYDYALLAVAQLAHEGIPVTLDVLGGDPPPDIGEQSERARILHTAGRLGLSGRVRLAGHLPQREVCRRLQHADALLHMSLTEGLPNAVLEAMACGLPVVATDVGGTREALRDGIDGRLVNPRDFRAAAAALRQLWLDADLRTRMGEAAHASVLKEFTVERQTAEWLELYESLVTPHRVSR